MHVSLAEALEVRGGPLQEEEVWAVLSQSAESLQELFHKGMNTSAQMVLGNENTAQVNLSFLHTALPHILLLLPE